MEENEIITEHLLASDFTREERTRSRISPSKTTVKLISSCPSCGVDLDYKHGILSICECGCHVLRHGNEIQVTARAWSPKKLEDENERKN